jgi:phosphoglycolate phosphatase-like HAD superfamily hydrolase
MDLYAAAEAGVSGIGVATGIYTREELEESNTGAVVLDNLSDVASVLDSMGLADGGDLC